MLEISAVSMKAFQQEAETTFVDRATGHMQWRYERLFAVAPREGLRQAVKLGYERAKGCGIGQAENIVEYVSLAFSLGAQFDHDPQLPWASRILSERGRLDEGVWVGQLLSRATGYLRNVQGENATAFVNAMQRLSTQKIEPTELTAGTFAANMRQLYPEKAHYMGGDCIRALWEHEQAAAAGKFRRDLEFFNLLLAMKFVFGIGCLTDPLLIAVCGQGQPLPSNLNTVVLQKMICNGLRAWLS